MIVRLGRRRPPETLGLSIRLDWTEPDPDLLPGHEIAGFFTNRWWARRRCMSYGEWFAGAPHRGRALATASLVEISWSDYQAHDGRWCRAPVCPTGDPVFTSRRWVNR